MDDSTHEMCELGEALLRHYNKTESATASVITKGIVMSNGNSLFRSPLLWFAIGAAAGYYGYKHRKEFADLLAKANDMGRDFVQQQRENLEDLLEEAREAEEAAGGDTSETPSK
jgi:hypothetical protein